MLPSYRRILFATDLSEISLKAWPHAIALAGRFGAEICAVTVIEEPVMLAAFEGYAVLLEAYRNVIPQIEERLFERTRDAPKSVTVRRVVLESPSPPNALLEFATKEGCDLIVVATHGRSGLSRFLLGSVAERLLRLSPIPVLVVRGEDA